MTDLILTERDGAVLKIYFNRPDKKNALTQDMYEAVNQALTDADQNDDIRVIYLSSVGDAFTAGNDLMDFRDRPPVSPDAPVMQFLRLIAGLETPVVAAVGGIAVGVGLTMLLHFDVVVASDQASFSVPFVDLALVPEAASSLLLPARVGRALASDMFLTGRRLSAEEALATGIISRVYEAEHLETEALAIAHSLAKKAPGAVKYTKSLIQPDISVVKDRIAAEARIFAQQLQSPELLEAIMAFMEKRPPNFG